MSTPLSKRNPNWLARQCEFDPMLNRNYRRSVRYYRQLLTAWPDWCADDRRFKIIYAECARRRARGEKVSVDHIVPIMSKFVCGLHVPWNLQIITEKEQNIKSNTCWPDNPHETIDMFGGREPYQLRLV